MKLLLGVVALLAVAACVNKGTPVADAKAEEQAIRTLNKQWSDAANRKDLEAILTFYAPDATAVFPDHPAAVGNAALRTLWQNDLATPGLISMSWTPERVEIAAAGDMATDFGRVDSEFQDKDGSVVKSTDKYLTIWKKVDGTWKVYYDAWNSNAPMQ